MTAWAPRYIPGANADRWWVLLESTVGRLATPFPDPDGALTTLRYYRKVPTRYWRGHVVGGAVVDDWNQVSERWGDDFDVAGPARWTGFEGLDFEVACWTGCRIPRGRLSAFIEGKRFCLPCVYATEANGGRGKVRPHQIQQAPWLPPHAEAKQKVERSSRGDGGDTEAPKRRVKTYEEPRRWRFR